MKWIVILDILFIIGILFNIGAEGITRIVMASKLPKFKVIEANPVIAETQGFEGPKKFPWKLFLGMILVWMHRAVLASAYIYARVKWPDRMIPLLSALVFFFFFTTAMNFSKDLGVLIGLKMYGG